MQTLRRAALIALSLAGLGAPPAHAAPPGGLCHAPEVTYFACDTARHKSIALCGSLPGTLQYRFGAPGRVELSHPGAAAGGTEAFAFAHYFRFQTDRTEVSFSNAGVDYALFDHTEAGRRRAGVRVTFADGKERELVCTGRVTSRLGELKAALRCDADNALNVGECR